MFWSMATQELKAKMNKIYMSNWIYLNTWRPEQNGSLFADNIFKLCSGWKFFVFRLRFHWSVPELQTDNRSVLILIMIWLNYFFQEIPNSWNSKLFDYMQITTPNQCYLSHFHMSPVSSFITSVSARHRSYNKHPEIQIRVMLKSDITWAA